MTLTRPPPPPPARPASAPPDGAGAAAARPPVPATDAVPRGGVAALGNFDGVHRGHRALVARARALADARGAPALALTFEPHPQDYFRARAAAGAEAGAGGPGGAGASAPSETSSGAGGLGGATVSSGPAPAAPPLFRLTPPELKGRVLRAAGLDAVAVLRFDAALAALAPTAFEEAILRDRLGAVAVVTGPDFHYGARRAGTPETLAAAGARLGFRVERLDPVRGGDGSGGDGLGGDGGGRAAGAGEAGEAREPPLSSSRIRRLLEAGRVGEANAALGWRWIASADVRHGDARGRTLGYPTANLHLEPSCGLAHGIYAVRVRLPRALGGRVLGGVASFGRRPTFDDGAPKLEVNLFEFSGELYGETLDVEFLARLRGEARFNSVDALVRQMDADAAAARARLAAPDPTPSLLDDPRFPFPGE